MRIEKFGTVLIASLFLAGCGSDAALRRLDAEVASLKKRIEMEEARSAEINENQAALSERIEKSAIEMGVSDARRRQDMKLIYGRMNNMNANVLRLCATQKVCESH